MARFVCPLRPRAPEPMSDSQQRYRVIERLESGGMAEVFRAESEGLQGFRKQVAIKRVLPHLSSKKKFISMFLDEARLSAQLSHSNCVQVFDIGVGDNAFFIVMEFVDGANLKAIIEHIKKTGRDFPVEAAVYIGLELCKGLAYAHELTDNNGTALHIVHRDMSPPNVLITKNGEVKIVDFGLAKANSQLSRVKASRASSRASSPISPRGRDGPGGRRANRRVRRGHHPVGAARGAAPVPGRHRLSDREEGAGGRGAEHLHHQPQGPQELEKIIAKSLARDPQQRYATARDLGQDLSKFMFKYGVPVSTFDLSTLVMGAMKERQRHRPMQASIIDKLIEEALFEFTSLTDDAGKAPSGGARPIDSGALRGPVLAKPNAPAGGGFVNVGSWIDEISVSSKPDDDALRASLPPGLSEGNLAALEEEPEAPSSPPNMRAAMAPPTAPASAPKIPAPASSPRQPLPASPPSSRRASPEKKGGGGAKVGFLVALVVVMAAGAAAWFTHLIPHP